MIKFETLKAKTADFIRSEKGTLALSTIVLGTAVGSMGVIGGVIGAQAGASAVNDALKDAKLAVYLSPETLEMIQKM